MEDPMYSPDYWKRERDVFNLYAAFRDIQQIPNLGSSPDTHAIPDDFVPKPATDASLAAFAQLATFRLDVQRCMISLLNGDVQYVLAEATKKTSLRTDSPLNKDTDLFVGSSQIPLNWGLCDKLLDPVALADGDAGIVMVRDLSQCEEYAQRSYVKEGPQFRFYAGVPIISPNKNIVGSVCILDEVARSGMCREDIMYLQDLASTVMDYLTTYTMRDQHHQAAEGLRGLISFSEGDLNLQPFDGHDLAIPPLSETPPKSTKAGGIQIQDEPEKRSSVQGGFAQPSTSPRPSQRGSSQRSNPISYLQNMILPSTTKNLFTRAADIVQASRDMDGVVFLDASVSATGYTAGDMSPARMRDKPCQVLSFATKDQSSSRNQSLSPDMIPLEADFTSVLNEYPQGCSLDCAGLQAAPVSYENAPATDFPTYARSESENQTQRQMPKGRFPHFLRLQEMFPGIKSALFLPLWDFERSRWYAGCFCWSTRAERSLSGALELSFLRVFGHSIMREVTRLDATNASQVKTTFLSSLSHELRSPLHGILGSVQLLRYTLLDNFQSNMVNSIAVCGRTLLETVQHLLDHAERKESESQPATKSFPDERTICFTSESPAAQMISSGPSPVIPYCNIGLVTEEVVEAIFLGQGRFDVSIGGDDSELMKGLNTMPGGSTAERRSRFLIVDIADHASLDFEVSASSYGRLIMNLLGNALKFTDVGCIVVSVRSNNTQEENVPLEIKINDTGIGMSKDFLFNEAFEPFRKYSQHSVGTGVGLNVVKRIIEDIGGAIKVTSDPKVGTDITLQLPLGRYQRPHDAQSPHTAILNTLESLKNRKVCVLHSKPPDEDGPPDHLRHWNVLMRYIATLSRTMSHELKMNVTETTELSDCNESDVIVCPEVSFLSLGSIRKTTLGRTPAILFIAMDMIEADALRYDARITSQDSVVEIMTQPCGPFKLGMVLSECLRRHDGKKPSPNGSESPYKHDANTQGPVRYGSETIADLAPRLGLYPPLAGRAKEGSRVEPDQPLPPPDATTEDSDSSKWAVPHHALIVDDNAINRRLLSVFMKKRKLRYAEAKDGKEALQKYCNAEEKFNIILMDISMPVMDGMTSTRLIREHEEKNQLEAAHIIVLTGLTSASAKLESWTSGVDDFLTKPVDFKELEKLMKAGKGGEGTGFMDST